MRLLVILAVLFILVLAFFLRVYFSFDTVFSYPIKYASDDGIYHMRIVENELLGGHFPKKIYFDPYTNFPQGTYFHFGPLYDQLLAFLIWIFSLGNPSQEIIDLISPFYPPVLGVLAILVIYFIGKVLDGNALGLISALFAAISPSLIFRSLLGATDHHVGEIFFSSLAIFSLFCLLKFQEKREPQNQISKRIYSLKWWSLVLLTAIALGLYFLVWPGALLFSFIFFTFFIFFFLQEYLNQRPWQHILLSGAIIFFIVLIILIPYLGHPNLSLSPLYNLRHILSLLFGLFSFLICWLLAELFSRKKIKRIFFLPSLFLIGLFFIILIYFIFPGIFSLFLDTLKAINTSFSPAEKARELTAEMRPLGLQGAINTFLAFFFFSFLGLAMVIYKFLKEHQATDLLIIIWFFSTFFITGIFPSSIGQLKYMYYLWVVVTLLSALFFWQTLVFSWKGLRIIQEKRNSPLFPYALIGSLLSIFFLLTFLLYPFPFNLFAPYPANLPQIVRATISISQSPIQYHQDWYEVLGWLRQNTPRPSLGYYSLYEEPKVDPKTKKIIPYHYPPDSYGVLARWDKGHGITYYAQRMAVSNPFHQGIGKKEGDKVIELGDGVFFLETNEKVAIEYLDQLKVRYLITDSDYAHPDRLFRNVVKWVQKELKGYTEEDIGEGPSRFDYSMIARLHLLDGRGTITERKRGDKTLKFEIPPLDHFRLIYESTTDAPADYFKYSPEDVIKMVKVFEYVKGAKIVGTTSLNQEVSISTEITTNQKRKFIYEKKSIAENGSFEIIVPYSTSGAKGRQEGQTQFVVFAKPYKLKSGDKEIEINISEKDVLEGKTIKINI